MLRYTPRLEQAVRVAAYAHRNQTRKLSDTPYIVHPFSVMTLASTVTDDEDSLIACLFHDIIEDVPEEYPEERMRQEFGDNVVAIVRGVTNDGSIENWRQRNEDYLASLRKAPAESVIVSCADKIHNLMSTLADHAKIGDKVWERFTTQSAPDQLWWYESVLSTVRELGAPELLAAQLEGLIGELRGIVK